MIPEPELVTRRECERSHAEQERARKAENEYLTKSVDGFAEQLGKVWDSLDAWRNTISEWRNHMPPWGVAIIGVQAGIIGASIATIAILARGG